MPLFITYLTSLLSEWCYFFLGKKNIALGYTIHQFLV